MFAVSNNAQTQVGSDILEIQTEAIGYQAIAGDTKLQLVSPWPLAALPKPTSSLISIASRNELLAAAGPNTLVIASSSAVREAFAKDTPSTNNVKSFTPQLAIDVPRLSQVAFTSDENYLVISAEEGGGLVVFDVQGLKNGNTKPAFQLETNRTAVRAIVPNPAPENAHVVSIVLTNGQLLLANLKEQQFAQGSKGAVLRDGVSCISWSVKGKQLVAGLGNGTAVQMDPAGDTKAEIPRPPQLDGDQHVSSITWLANDLFLTIYNPTNFEMEHVPDSTYMLVTRQPKTTNYTFQKMQDPVGTFGMNRCPPHHFLLRLRDFPPNLTDALLVSSTGSGEIGLITCAKTPLSGDPAFAQTANTYTTTGILDDARRAQLPVYDEMNDMSGSSDTSPIGMVLDLSSRDSVKRPMPAEEIDASSTPLPGLMVLNNEGVLSSWWFVYSESVRQKTCYPALAAAARIQTPDTQITQHQQQSSAFGTFSGSASPFGSTASKPALGSGDLKLPAFGAPAALEKATGWGSSVSNSTGPQFGKASFGMSTPLGAAGNSTFGTTTPLGKAGNPAFGTSTPLGATPNPTFGSSTALSGAGKPAFGTNTPLGAGTSGFGTVGGLGKSGSPWGASATPQSSSEGGIKPIPFGSSATPSSFALFGQSSEQAFSPFSKLASNSSTFGSLGQQQPRSSFASQASTTSTTFGAPSQVGQNKLPLWGASAQENGTTSNSATKSASGLNSTGDSNMTASAMEEDGPTTSAKPATKSKGVFGTGSSGFQLNSSFVGDGTAKDDLPKPPASSLFESAFGVTYRADAGGAPATPIKEEPISPQPSSFASTTPKSPSMSKTAGASIPSQFSLGTQRQDRTADEPTRKLSEPPLPPSPKLAKPQVVSEPAPLPSSPTPQKQDEVPPALDDHQGALSPAGSPPVDLGEPNSSRPSSSLPSYEDETTQANVADDAPLPPDFVAPSTSNVPSLKPTTPSRNFPYPDFKSSPLATSFSTTPIEPSIPQKPYTLASAIQPPILFPQPSNLQDSSRSPSPVRSKGPAANQRSLLSPTHSAFATSTTPAGQPPGRLQVQSQSQQPSFQLSKPVAPAPVRQAEPETTAEDLFDDIDDDAPEELSAPLYPKKRLFAFLTHQDYVSKIGGEGIPAQIQKLLRDINSMIDTCGLNARNLTTFVKGHSELIPDGGRERADLEDDEDWCLVEIEDLAIVQKNLLDELESERLQDVKEKIGELRKVLEHIATQRKRHHEIKKLMDANNEPNEDESAPRPELTGEQSAVLSELRKELANVQNLLTKAEDGISLLKAKLASSHARNNGVGATTKVPTVEAIVNTIAKMTRMFEEKSGDVDLLEAQMRRLRFKARTHREGTPSTLDEALGRLSIGSHGADDRTFSTPLSSKSKRAGTYALTYSPESSDDEFSSFRDSLRSSPGPGGTKQLNLPKVTNREIKLYAKRKADRKQFMRTLKEVVHERGARITNGQ